MDAEKRDTSSGERLLKADEKDWMLREGKAEKDRNRSPGLSWTEDISYIYMAFSNSLHLKSHHSVFDGFSALIKTVTQLLLSTGENT